MVVLGLSAKHWLMAIGIGIIISPFFIVADPTATTSISQQPAQSIYTGTPWNQTVNSLNNTVQEATSLAVITISFGLVFIIGAAFMKR